MQRRRPALVVVVVVVVVVPNAPGAPALLWVLMVTSAANRGWPGNAIVSDLDAAALPARSAKIATIEGRDAELIGQSHPRDRTRVIESLRGSLAQVLATRGSAVSRS